MCGIAGIIHNYKKELNKAHIQKMADTLSHRGPDGEGFWSNKTGNVQLGHRRLSIIDLSENASQPMSYLNRYHIVHNGEIYNYVELKSLLIKKGYQFVTQSDTEVLVAAYDCWKEDCLRQLDGMFAFAIWDEKDEKFFAARDRFGEKPFYYYQDEEHFIFASEMKALWAIGVEKKMDNKMLLNYLTLGYVQNPSDKEQTFYELIYSLPPAHYLKFNLPAPANIPITRYWSINKESNIKITEKAASEKFIELFQTSLIRRLRSDVQLGTSLSGGLDSSSIAETICFLQGDALQKKNGHQLKTFSAVFPGFLQDESGYIKSVTGFLGIDNFQVEPTADQLINDFEALCNHQEEPFQSAGIYAQYRVYGAAAQNGVKVLLDGQGADELLAGYPRYIHWYLQEVLNRHRLNAARNELHAFRKNNQPIRWDIRNYFAAFLPSHAAIQLEKKEYQKTITHPYIHPEFLKHVNGRNWEGIHKPIVTKLNDILHFNLFEMGLEEMLRFADRNSMAHGCEIRLPFLQHELAEFIYSMPAGLKMKNGFTKHLLRSVMDKKLPDEIVWRKDKVGFEPPQQKWMEDNNMQDMMQESKRKLVKSGVLLHNVLLQKPRPLPAHEKDNYDWRYLCAARFL